MSKTSIENTRSLIEMYQEKMIALVNQIKPGSIISKCVCNNAMYYKVTSIIDHCISPALAHQDKTLELECIGIHSMVTGINNRKIYYYDEILPYAQMIIK